MRCNCCNRKLEEKEIQWNPDIKTWEMCGVCLEIAYDAAYSDGFQHDDTSDGFILVGEELFDDDVMYTDSLSSLFGGSSFNDEQDY